MSARSHGAEGIRTARRGHERGRPPNEAAVVHELRELARGRTATVIGHRLSTVRHAEAFTAELRRDVVEVTRNSGLTQEQVAKDFGTSVHSVYRWCLSVVRHGEAYHGELDRLAGWVERINDCLLPTAARAPQRQAGPARKIIGAVSPSEPPQVLERTLCHERTRAVAEERCPGRTVDDWQVRAEPPEQHRGRFAS